MGDITIIATAGASNANSYATVAQADAYHDGHTRATTWDAAEPQTKRAALVHATRLLDALYEWDGGAATTTQKLAHPRYGLWNRNGDAIASNAIAPELVDATAELARQLLAGDIAADNAADVDGLKRVKAGSVEIEFRDVTGSRPIPDQVWALVRHLGQLKTRRQMSVGLVRG